MNDEQKDENLKDENAENIAKADVVAEDKTDLKKKSLFGRQCKDCEKHKLEAGENKLRWQRALADYQNLQKETAARRAEWAKLSEQQILEEFIPVYEHLKMAVTLLPLSRRDPSFSGPEGETERGREQWIDGIKHIKKQFADILKSHGVEEIKTVGERFDPAYHEAVGHEAIEGAGEDEIIREVAGGYKMGERVIRAAKVIVNKN